MSRRVVRRPVRPVWAGVAAAATLLVLWFTLREDRYVAFANLTGSNFVPLRHHLAALRCWLEDCDAAAVAAEYLLVDVVGNVALFVPLGFALAAVSTRVSRWGRFLAAGLCAFALSVAIETVQLAMPSRASDVDDVLFNTLGGLAGGLAGVLLAGRAGRRRRGA